MKHIDRWILLSTLILIINGTLAETSDDILRDICRQHAITSVSRIKLDVLPDMERDQINKAIQLTTENCLTSFADGAAELPTASDTVTGTQVAVEKDESEEDWFTKHILEGNPPGKAGNQRLKRMQHK